MKHRNRVAALNLLGHARQFAAALRRRLHVLGAWTQVLSSVKDIEERLGQLYQSLNTHSEPPPDCPGCGDGLAGETTY